MEAEGKLNMSKISGRIESLGMDRFAEIMELSQFAFQYVRSEQEQIKERFAAEPAARWGVIVGDQLAAQASVLELTTYIAGKTFAMGGVAGVATWPEYRRQGFVGKLLVHALEDMRKKGQVLSFLHPFSYGFYRKYGWETYTEHKTYTIQTSQLPPRVAYKGQIERVKGYDCLYEIYDAYAKQYNGTLARTELWWKYRIRAEKPSQIAIYRDTDGEVKGYLIYKVQQKEMKVDELVSLTTEAYTALWSFIAQHDSMIEKVTVNAPIDDRVADMLPDPRIKQEVVPYTMGRVVDVEEFLAQYPFLEADKEDHVYLQVIDEHAPWNNGSYELIVSASGQAAVNRLEEGQANQDDDRLQLDIGALTMLFLSYRKGRELSFIKRIQGKPDTLNRLQNRIPERTSYLPDFF